jgi:hypothetical protein
MVAAQVRFEDLAGWLGLAFFRDFGAAWQHRLAKWHSAPERAEVKAARR